MLDDQSKHSWQLCSPLKLHVGGWDLRLYGGSELKAYLQIRGLGPDVVSVVRSTGPENLHTVLRCILYFQRITFLIIYLTSLQLVIGTVWRR